MLTVHMLDHNHHKKSAIDATRKLTKAIVKLVKMFSIFNSLSPMHHPQQEDKDVVG